MKSHQFRVTILLAVVLAGGVARAAWAADLGYKIIMEHIWF